MNIYDFYRMHSATIERAKRKRQERRKIRKTVMEKKRRKARNNAANNSYSIYYFEKGKCNKILKNEKVIKNVE